MLEEEVVEKKKEKTNKQNGVWQIHTNQELLNMCREPDIISEIRKGRLRWLGHVERLPISAQFLILNEL